jgi:hypothetical protein
MKTSKGLSFWFLSVGFLVGVGCSNSGQGPLDAFHDESKIGAGSPATEVWISFAAPGAKWSAPQSVAIHFDLTEPNLKTSVQASIVQPVMGDRKIASQGTDHAATREEIRTLIADIAHSPQDRSPCAYPIHVKWVDAAAKSQERWGCRSESGWSGKVSDLVARVWK